MKIGPTRRVMKDMTRPSSLPEGFHRRNDKDFKLRLSRGSIKLDYVNIPIVLDGL